jgi:hypothetical protein
MTSLLTGFHNDWAVVVACRQVVEILEFTKSPLIELTASIEPTMLQLGK